MGRSAACKGTFVRRLDQVGIGAGRDVIDADTAGVRVGEVRHSGSIGLDLSGRTEIRAAERVGAHIGTAGAVRIGHASRMRNRTYARNREEHVVTGFIAGGADAVIRTIAQGVADLRRGGRVDAPVAELRCADSRRYRVAAAHQVEGGDRSQARGRPIFQDVVRDRIILAVDARCVIRVIEIRLPMTSVLAQEPIVSAPEPPTS